MNLDLSVFKDVLSRNYGVDVVSVDAIKGGWSASAFVAAEEEGRKFLVKQYDKSRSSTAKLTSGVETYLALVEWLNDNTDLSGRIVSPVRTVGGEFKYENDLHIYLLSEYIEGSNLIGKEFNGRDVIRLADIVAELHRYGEEIPLPTEDVREDFEIYLYRQSLSLMATVKVKDLRAVVATYGETITDGLDHLSSLARELKTMPLRYVLCHTDIHEGNLLRSENSLHLIDWEELKLAPGEADLFHLVNKPWFGLFNERYREVHGYYALNRTALRFYTLRRSLEDIWEFMEQLQFDDPDTEERVELLKHLCEECESLRQWSIIENI